MVELCILLQRLCMASAPCMPHWKLPTLDNTHTRGTTIHLLYHLNLGHEGRQCP